MEGSIISIKKHLINQEASFYDKCVSVPPPTTTKKFTYNYVSTTKIMKPTILSTTSTTPTTTITSTTTTITTSTTTTSTTTTTTSTTSTTTATTTSTTTMILSTTKISSPNPTSTKNSTTEYE